MVLLMRKIILDIHGKFVKDKKKLEENISDLQCKIHLITSNEKEETTIQEVEEKAENFLNAKYINKEILFDIVDRIEIDENKKIYIYFNFEQLNIYNN